MLNEAGCFFGYATDKERINKKHPLVKKDGHFFTDKECEKLADYHA